MKDDEFMRKHIDALNKIEKQLDKLNKNTEELNVYAAQIANHTNPKDGIRIYDDSTITEADKDDKVAWIKTKFGDPMLFCSACGAEVGLKGFTTPAKCHKCGRTFIGVDNVL